MANRNGTAALLIIASVLVVAVTLAGATFAVTSCEKTHQVQAGETCFSVGRAAGLTLGQFLAFNPNVNCNKLFVGQWVCIG